MSMAQADFVRLDSERRAFFALPDGDGPHPAVLLFMEAFGLNDYIRSECVRLAEAGYAALAPDYYRGETYGYEEMDPVYAKLASLTDDFLLGDVRAGVAYLDDHAAVRRDRYGVVGFCMGGRLAFLTAAELGAKIAAVACFYPAGVAPDEPSLGRPILTRRIPEIVAPLLLNYGADDESISPAERGRLTEKLSEAGKPFTLSTYTEAGHGFASRDRPSFNPGAASLAWDATLGLFARNLQTGSMH